MESLLGLGGPGGWLAQVSEEGCEITTPVVPCWPPAAEAGVIAAAIPRAFSMSASMSFFTLGAVLQEGPHLDDRGLFEFGATAAESCCSSLCSLTKPLET